MCMTNQQAATRQAEQQNEAERLREVLKNLVAAIDDEIPYTYHFEAMSAAMAAARRELAN